MRKYFLIFLMTFSSLSLASDKGLDLAVESYRFLQSYESLLDGAIKSGDPVDYNRFIFTPTLEQFRKWPRLGTDKVYDKYYMCHMALDDFRIYSDEQFHAGGALPKSALSFRKYAKKKKQCRASLGKNI